MLNVSKASVPKTVCDYIPTGACMLLDHFHIDRIAILHIEASTSLNIDLIPVAAENNNIPMCDFPHFCAIEKTLNMDQYTFHRPSDLIVLNGWIGNCVQFDYCSLGRRGDIFGGEPKRVHRTMMESAHDPQ